MLTKLCEDDEFKAKLVDSEGDSLGKLGDEKMKVKVSDSEENCITLVLKSSDSKAKVFLWRKEEERERSREREERQVPDPKKLKGIEQWANSGIEEKKKNKFLRLMGAKKEEIESVKQNTEK